MYEKDIDELSQVKLLNMSTEITAEEYVKKFIEYVTDIFNKERGRDETKKANLGDIKSTQVDTSILI